MKLPWRKGDGPGKRRARGALEPLGWRARPGAAGPNPQDLRMGVGEPGWPVIDGPHYLDVLGALHAAWRPEWYLEIGVFKGHSFALAQGDAVGVDPQLQLAHPPALRGRRLHLFQMTSEAFFADGFLAREGVRPDLAFLDGLHQSEALLADFIAAERAAAPGGRILLHDCLPSSEAMTARRWEDDPTLRFWAGDVWKTAAVLVALRPDLRIVALDAWPTGLLVIDHLDPQDARLAQDGPAAAAALRDVSLSEYGRERYFTALPIQSSVAYVGALAR